MRARPDTLPGLAQLPPKLERGLGTTVHAQIEDWLAGEIAAGRLAPGGDPVQPRAQRIEGGGGVRLKHSPVKPLGARPTPDGQHGSRPRSG